MALGELRPVVGHPHLCHYVWNLAAASDGAGVLQLAYLRMASRRRIAVADLLGQPVELRRHGRRAEAIRGCAHRTPHSGLEQDRACLPRTPYPGAGKAPAG